MKKYLSYVIFAVACFVVFIWIKKQREKKEATPVERPEPQTIFQPKTDVKVAGMDLSQYTVSLPKF